MDYTTNSNYFYDQDGNYICKYSLVINGEVSEQHSITESVSAHLDRLDEMNMDYYIFEARAINFLLEQAAK